MPNDEMLLDSFRHWRAVGYSVQTAMMLALVAHGANPGRPEQGSQYEFMVNSGLQSYQRVFTNIRREDLV